MGLAFTTRSIVGVLASVVLLNAAPAFAANDAAVGAAQVAANEWKGLPGASVVRDPVIRKRLNSTARLRHTVAIVPMYEEEKPDEDVTRRMAAQAERLYEREIPGFTWRTKIAKSMKVVNLCARRDWVSLASRKSGVNWSRSGNHVVAYAPECRLGATGLYGDGFGWVKLINYDPGGTALAHEIGHNFNLNHANVLSCRSGNKPVSLSAKCREDEYDNVDDVMGAVIQIGSDFPSAELRRFGPVWQAELTGRAKVIKPGKTTTMALSSSGERGKQAAIVRTQFGAVYLGAQPNNGNSAVTAEVRTRGRNGGAARLNLVEATNRDGTQRWGSPGPDPLPALGLGSSWVIPGSGLRVTVIATDDSGATLRFTPRKKADKTSPSPVTDPVDVQSEEERILRWTPVPGAIAYIVRADDTIIARSAGDSAEANITSIAWWSDEQITITTVGIDGTESPPVVVPVDRRGS